MAVLLLMTRRRFITLRTEVSAEDDVDDGLSWLADGAPFLAICRDLFWLCFAIADWNESDQIELGQKKDSASKKEVVV